VLSEDIRRGLNTALNESRLLSVQVDRVARTATVWFDVLTLPKQGPASANTVTALVLGRVTRVAVSLREGRWDDQHAAVTPVTLDRLDAVVRAFGGQPIYGGEFIDPTEELWAHWRERLSLDDVLSPEPSHHVVQLFQEGSDPDRILDLRLWFTELGVVDGEGRHIELEQFVAGGRRWWDALSAGDPRTAGHGIFTRSLTTDRGFAAATFDNPPPRRVGGEVAGELSWVALQNSSDLFSWFGLNPAPLRIDDAELRWVSVQPARFREFVDLRFGVDARENAARVNAIMGASHMAAGDVLQKMADDSASVSPPDEMIANATH